MFIPPKIYFVNKSHIICKNPHSFVVWIFANGKQLRQPHGCGSSTARRFGTMPSHKADGSLYGNLFLLRKNRKIEGVFLHGIVIIFNGSIKNFVNVSHEHIKKILCPQTLHKAICGHNFLKKQDCTSVYIFHTKMDLNPQCVKFFGMFLYM